MSTPDTPRIVLLEDLARQLAAAEQRLDRATERGLRRHRPRLRTRSRLLAGPSLAGLGLLLIVAVSAAATGAIPSMLDAQRSADPPNQPPVTNIAPALLEAFPILARPRTSADALPAGAGRRLGISHPVGENIALSRAVKTAAGTGWIVPANGGLCVVVPDPALSDPAESWGISCTPAKYATTYGALTGTLDFERSRYETTFTALVPAGGKLIATYRDGHKAALPVSDGVATGHITNATRLAVHTPAGVRAELNLIPPNPNRSFVDCRDGHIGLVHKDRHETPAQACSAP